MSDVGPKRRRDLRVPPADLHVPNVSRAPDERARVPNVTDASRVRTDRCADETRGRSRTRVYTIASAVLLLVAAALWAPVLASPAHVPLAHPAWYIPVVLLLAFAAGELFPLRFEVRSEILLVSLSELPLVLGLLLLPPWMVGAAYGLAAVIAFAARRGRLRSAVMNLALIAAESGSAVILVHLLAGSVGSGDLLAVAQPRFPAVAVGAIAGALVSAVAVGLIRRATGSTDSIRTLVARSMLTAVLVVGLTLAGFTVWTAIPRGPVLCLALMAIFILLYRNYFAFLQQHAGLAGLYEFGASVARAGVDIATWQNLVQQVGDQIGARIAALYLTDRSTGPAVLAADADGPIDLAMPPAGDPLLDQALRDGFAIAQRDRTSDPAVAEALTARGATDVIIVALKSADRDRGFVEIRDSRSRWSRLDADDLTLLRTLAGHLATALDNHGLVSRLQREAYHDPVTGLANRSGLEVRGAELAKAGGFGGVLLLDLGVLGDVTSALGHDHGEQLLVTVGERLSQAVGEDAVVGRVDADRFAVLFGRLTEDEARRFADAVLAIAARAIVVDGVEVEPNVVGGIAFNEHPEAVPISGNVLLQQAQLALVFARAKGERLAIYRPAIGEVYQRRFQLVSQFRHAVDTGRITVYYQPKLTLVERELIGVEALVRWMHPEYGFVAPTELIDAIENTSAIDVLFRHMLDQSLAQIAAWSARGLHISVAVNLSVRNLLAPDLARIVADALATYRVPAELLTLEVTESSVMDQPERALPALRELHTLGIRLSVDDFGTGYSSLAYLRRLPIDEIKIDKSFVQGMVTDLGDLAIVRAIIDLGHSLGLRVVAEGVEEEAGRDALRSMKCDAMQGFLLARPLPIDRFESWLTSRTVPQNPGRQGEPALLRMRA
ncbi:MAG: hypothetical protein BGO26_16435 [Actinobacteria bacterium 69-20]|nr:MAG: hypothetical protein BGO26_16435 [Actinobacteria bacterium 69-20]